MKDLNNIFIDHINVISQDLSSLIQIDHLCIILIVITVNNNGLLDKSRHLTLEASYTSTKVGPLVG